MLALSEAQREAIELLERVPEDKWTYYYCS